MGGFESGAGWPVGSLGPVSVVEFHKPYPAAWEAKLSFAMGASLVFEVNK